MAKAETRDGEGVVQPENRGDVPLGEADVNVDIALEAHRAPGQEMFPAPKPAHVPTLDEVRAQ